MGSVLHIEGILKVRPPEKFSGGRIALGTVVDGWRVVAFVGAGLSAEVYRVVGIKMGGEAALKLLVDSSSGLDLRFSQEMEVLRSLAIPSLPRFFGSGEFGGRPYYVAEYLQPLILPLPKGEIVPFVAALARAVGDLHAAGYLHRDLKPANVLRRRNGEPVLIDLGLVKRIDGGSTPGRKSLSIVNGRRVGVGTVGFAAPEQLLSGVSSVRSDVFSLGQMFKECGGKKLGRAARQVIRTATTSDPEDRYASAAEFETAVRKLGRRSWWRWAAALLAVALVSLATQIRWAGPRNAHPGTVPKSGESPQGGDSPLSAAPAPSLTRQPGESEEAHFARLIAEARRGNVSAECAAAEAYYHGRGVKQNHNEAARLYRHAAEANHSGAQVSLGNCLLRGIGCEKDAEEAVVWLRRAAESGNLGAMVDLAFCLRNGIGTKKDETEAFLWAMKAAESGHAAAQAFVGECYLEGYGVDQDQRRADDWLQRAARQGNERAKLLLRTR